MATPAGELTEGRRLTVQESAAAFFREAEANYPVLVDTPPNAIVATDEENRIVFWNACATSLFGRERDAVIGRPLSEIIELAGQSLWGNGPGETTDEREEFAATVKAADGRLVPVTVYRSVRLLPAGRIGTYVIRDMSMERLYDSELVRLSGLNMVGQLASAMGHEVRNPITTVRGFLQLLSRKDSPHREYYAMMIGEIDRANAIISQYLSLARNKAPTLVPESLATIVLGLQQLIEASAIEHGRHIHMDVGRQPLPVLMLDSHEIKQLVMNLVANALEASPDGGMVTVGVSGGAREVVLTVGDNGPGIPDEILGKLGTPFLTTKPEGHGLGLAVCYQIADRHKASIQVASDPATGTVFSIVFPVS